MATGFSSYLRLLTEWLIFAIVFMAVVAGSVTAQTRIDNRASISAQSAGSTLSGTSNVVSVAVQGVVTQCQGELQQSQSITIEQGETTYLRHRITNTGSCTHAFDLSTTDLEGVFSLQEVALFADVDRDGQPDSTSPITRSPVLRPGETFNFVLRAKVPESATNNTTDSVQVNARIVPPNTTSTIGEVRPVTDKIFANKISPDFRRAGLSLAKSFSQSSGPSPFDRLSVSILITNFNQFASEKTDVNLIDTLPEGMTYIDGSSRITVDRGPVVAGVVLTDAPGGDPTGFDYAVEQGKVIKLKITRMDREWRGTLTFDVRVAAQLAPSTTLTNIARVDWLDNMQRRDGPEPSNPATYVIAENVGVSFEGQTLPTIKPGEPTSFVNTLTNQSSIARTFNISFEASGFPSGTVVVLTYEDGSPLRDSNGDGLVDSGVMQPNASRKIIARVTLPVSATGGPFSLTKKAIDVTNPTLTAIATDRADRVEESCRVVLEPDNTGRVAPGASITYRHVLRNVGNCIESITFPAGFYANDPRWTGSFVIDNAEVSAGSNPGQVDDTDTVVSATITLNLAPGQSILLLSRVTAPTDAAVGVSNNTTIRVNANRTGPLTNRDVTTVAAATVIDNTIINYVDSRYQFPTVWTYIGGTINLQAVAASCNADPAVIDRRIVRITSPRGEIEEFEAVETGVNTGVFFVRPIATSAPPVRTMSTIIEGLPNDVLFVELLGCGRSITTTVTLINASSIVFDSETNKPVAGATVTLVRLGVANAGASGTCEGTVANVSADTGGTMGSSPNPVKTGEDGRFAFPMVDAGTYCIRVLPPNGYAWPSARTTNQLLPFARNLNERGSFGGSFTVDRSGSPVVVDIPVDVAALGGLFIQKQALRTVVELGDSVDYVVRVSNQSTRALDRGDVMLVDDLPAGFTYVKGSAKLLRDGKWIALADPPSIGPRLTFTLGRLTAQSQIEVRYRLRVGAGALQGDGVNRATAIYRAEGLEATSNTAVARVQVNAGVFTDKGFVLGRVTMQCDKEAIGVPGARLLLQNGTSTTTDGEGKFSIYGLTAQTHVLRMDMSTLPRGATLIANDNRSSGNGGTRFVDLKIGEIYRADFSLRCEAGDEAVRAEVTARRKNQTVVLGETERTLKATFEGDPLKQQTQRQDVKGLPASGVVGNSVGNLAADTTAAPQSSVDAAKPVTVAGALASRESLINRSTQAAGQLPLEEQAETFDNALAIIGLKDGDIMPIAKTNIRVKGLMGARFKVTVNGKEVDGKRVGKKLTHADKKLEAWDFIAVDLAVGENVIRASQIDPFGNTRGEATVKVIAPGEPATLKIEVPRIGAVGDGKTPANIRVTLRDAKGTPVASSAVVTLDAARGKWETRDADVREPGLQVALEDGEAVVQLVPTTELGAVEIRANTGSLRATATLDVMPDLRSLIAAGLIEGVINLRNIDTNKLTPARTSDGFERELNALSTSWNDGKHSAAARAAFYLKGKIKGEYLLTAAYDSDKPSRDRLFRDIQPDEFYPIYGDSSARGFDAQSTSRFYVRIDHKKSYLLYGDFTTQTNNEARKLSQYSRSLTGAKVHYEEGTVTANAFASRDSSRQVIEELRGNGTSGPFVLKQSLALVNSEKIELIVRDRNQPAVILRSISQSRFADYEIEPTAGRILFKSPVPSLDAELNPVSIRVTYEVEQGGEAFWVAGADAQLRLSEKLEIGAVVVKDQNPRESFLMAGANATLKLSPKTTVTVEAAMTDRDAPTAAIVTNPGNPPSTTNPTGKGYAARIELKHKDEKLDAQGSITHADAKFSNPGASITAGRNEIAAKADYRVDANTRAKAEVVVSEDVATNAQRAGVLASIEKTFENQMRVEVGLRHARENSEANTAAVRPVSGSAADNTTPAQTSVTTVRGRLTAPVPQVHGANVYGELEVDVSDTGRKIAAIGGEAPLNFSFGSTATNTGNDAGNNAGNSAGNNRAPAAGRIYARHEFISTISGPYGLGSGGLATQRQNATVIGVDTEYMRDGRLFSEYRIREAIAGGDAEAAVGLRNMWNLTDAVKLSTNFERVHAISGRGDNESTAGAIGVEWTGNALWKGSTRLELRDGKSSDSVLFTVGFARKFGPEWTYLSRKTISIIRNSAFTSTSSTTTSTTDATSAATSADSKQILKRAQWGLAYRSQEVDGPTALARVEHRYESDTTQPEVSLKKSTTLVSLHGNVKLNKPFVVTGRYAARWADDQSNGTASKAFTQMLGLRGTYDISKKWDFSLHGAVVLSRGGARQHVFGAEIGYALTDQLWISGGYNWSGHSDPDLAFGDYTARGAYIRMRLKFDETTLADAPVIGTALGAKASKEARQ